MNQLRPKLEWNELYSVGVLEIDKQHQKLFAIINELITIVGGQFKTEDVLKIINSLLDYRDYHFATEEKYFKEFNYEDAVEHIVEHKIFGEKLLEIKERDKDNIVTLTFELIDFVEDWLVNHIMVVDQKYKECFVSHGLK